MENKFFIICTFIGGTLAPHPIHEIRLINPWKMNHFLRTLNILIKN